MYNRSIGSKDVKLDEKLFSPLNYTNSSIIFRQLEDCRLYDLGIDTKMI